MKNLYILVLVLVSSIALSQTKLISHKSHSGNNETFAIAVENNLFDITESDFGDSPRMRIERNSNLDSVIYVSNDKIIMVTSDSYTCPTESSRPINRLNLGIWKNGRQAIANHNLFKRNHALDSIKNVLKTEYNFNNDVDKVVFVGYDNQKEIKPEKNKKMTVPIAPNFPNIPNSFFLIVILGFLSILVYFISASFSNRFAVGS